jgi:hypothetical protein
MSFSFAGFTTQNYIGTVYRQPIQVAGKGGFAVKLSYNFLSYGAGAANSAIVVQSNLVGGAGGSYGQLLDRIRSIYIDNTGNPLPLYVKFPDTDFTVSAQPYSIGWYPVFTNGFEVLTGVFGFTNTNNQTSANIYVTNLSVAAFTDSSLQSTLEQNLASIVLASGSSIASIALVFGGQDYNSGNISITGGGGTGAVAHGMLDQWGRFTAIMLDQQGEGYTGLPTVAPSGGQTIPAVFNPSGTYNIGEKLVYNGTEWQYTGNPTAGLPIILNSAAWIPFDSYPPNAEVSYQGSIWGNASPNFSPSESTPAAAGLSLLGTVTPQAGSFWLNSGTAPGTAASFNTLLTAAATLITTSSIGVPALGDQAQNLIISITGAGVLQGNLWGTPYNSGFIYLTHLDVRALDSSPGTIFTIGNVDDYLPFEFNIQSTGPLLSLQKMNMKLDATVEWEINCSVWGGNGIFCSFGFAWTYSQQ